MFKDKENLDDTFSFVVKATTIQIVLTITLSKDRKIRQLDVNNGFLNGNLQEEVFMDQPNGFVDPLAPDFVCKLNKSLYGLKQTPRSLFEKLRQVIVDLGFTSTKSYQSLFVNVTPQCST